MCYEPLRFYKRVKQLRFRRAGANLNLTCALMIVCMPKATGMLVVHVVALRGKHEIVNSIILAIVIQVVYANPRPLSIV